MARQLGPSGTLASFSDLLVDLSESVALMLHVQVMDLLAVPCSLDLRLKRYSRRYILTITMTTGTLDGQPCDGYFRSNGSLAQSIISGFSLT